MDIFTASCLCTGFMGTFYIWRKERTFVFWALKDVRKAALDKDIYVDRNEKTVIQRRVISFSVGAIASALYLIAKGGRREPINLSQSLKYTVLCFCSTVTLFAGPLYEIYEDEVSSACSDLTSLTFFRDVLLCPLGEETFFRGVILDVLRNRTANEQIWLSSALFALSHSHHYFYFAATCFREEATLEEEEEEESNEKNDSHTTHRTNHQSIRACYRGAAVRLLCIHGITLTFGVLSSSYYLRVCNRCIPAISAMHMVCNAVGPPTFEFLRSTGMPTRKRITSAVLYVTGVLLWGYSLQYIPKASSASD